MESSYLNIWQNLYINLFPTCVYIHTHTFFPSCTRSWRTSSLRSSILVIQSGITFAWLSQMMAGSEFMVLFSSPSRAIRSPRWYFLSLARILWNPSFLHLMPCQHRSSPGFCPKSLIIYCLHIFLDRFSCCNDNTLIMLGPLFPLVSPLIFLCLSQRD